MIIETFSTGDEIRSGTVVDTNAAAIAQMFEDEGMEVVRHSCVGDNQDDIKNVLIDIGNRADVCIVTGGLGPTKDDVTAESAAKAAGVKIEVNKDAMKFVEEFFTSRNRSISESNRKQAMLPEGAECLFNPAGTAPGFSMIIGKCLFFFVPGVPFEMEKMIKEIVLPKLTELQGATRTKNIARTLVTFGLPESVVNDKLTGFKEQYPTIKLGFRAAFPEIHVKLYAKGDDQKQMGTLLDDAVSWVVQKLGNRIISTDNQNMEAVIGDLLSSRNETIALAESCTGGLISNWLTNVPGSSNYFLYAGVVYSNKAKIEVLGVSPEIIDMHGTVHEETAKEMADKTRRISGATYGLSTSGIAGPGGGIEEKPVGTVCIGLATKKEVKGYRFHFSYGGRRDMYKKIFAMTALEILRMKLLGVPDNEIELGKR